MAKDSGRFLVMWLDQWSAKNDKTRAEDSMIGQSSSPRLLGRLFIWYGFSSRRWRSRYLIPAISVKDSRHC